MRHYVNAFLLVCTLMPQIKSDPQPSWSQWWHYNLGIIQEGACYRTCQLNETGFSCIFTEKGITHNINLRGKATEKDWWHSDWLEEQGANQRHGVIGLDITLNEGQLPSVLSLQQMLASIHAPGFIKQDSSFFETKPERYLELKSALKQDVNSSNILLVHCRRGADRTGLFAALYTIEKEIDAIKEASALHKTKRKELKKLYQKAIAHLCLYHGHFFFVYPKMSEFIDIWWEIRKRLSIDDSIVIYRNFLAEMH